MGIDLIRAAERGEIDVMLDILEDGANINEVDERGQTAVMAATHANQVEAVRVLIDAGANIDIQDNMRDNPFLYAGAERLLEILKLTIEAGPDYSLVNRYGGSALIPAAHHGHVDCVLELVKNSEVNIDHVNNLGWTALLEAVILSDGGPVHQQIVQILVDHGARRDLGDIDGVTPLEHARMRGYEEMVRILHTG